MDFRDEGHIGKLLFLSDHTRDKTLICLITDEVDLDHLVEVVFARSPHAQVTFKPLSVSAEGKHKGLLACGLQNPFFPCA